MTYNSRVAKARETAGKPAKNSENAADIPREYLTDRQIEFESRKLRMLQYAYSRFFEKNTMTRKEFQKISNYTKEASLRTLKKLTDMGLLTCTTLYYNGNANLYTIKDEKYIPEGWPARGELLNMDSPYKDHVYITRSVASQSQRLEASDNPLTKMLANRNYHVKDVSGYEQLIKDTSRFYGTEELDSLVKAIHEICKTRIEQRYIECPLCRGRIQRTRSEIECTNCGKKLDGGTFEDSMRMIHIIARYGGRVQ